MRSFLIVITFVACYTQIAKVRANADDISAIPRPGSGEPKFDDVDWNLSKAMGINKKFENIVISPTSLRVVLALLLDAANGTTADEISKFMQIDKENLKNKENIRKYYKELIASFNGPHDSTLMSDVVTRIFAHQTASLNDTFLGIVKDSYGTELEKVDFTQLSDVIKKVNKWAEGATHGNIKDLLSEDDTNSNAVMLLLNVIFFNGLWTNPFNENDTVTDSFYLNTNQFVKSPMMKAQHKVDYAQTYDGELQLLRMPYQGGSFAMYFVLPRNRNGLDDLINNITPAKIHSLMKTMEPVVVNITIPRFKFSYNCGLKPVLQKFGIKEMFGLSADFSNMEVNTSSLFVSNILQKAGIEVNEKGSTAYAATVAETETKIRSDTVEFTADRPFLFFIEEDKTRTVVFVGKVSNPSAYNLSESKSSVKVPQNSQTLQNKNSQQEVTTQQMWSSTNSFTSPQIPAQPSKPAVTYNEQDQDLASKEASKLSRFDNKLLEEVGYSNQNQNIVLSPASIKTVLGLLLHGANESTASQLQMTLHLSDDQQEAEKQLHRVQKTLLLMGQKFPVKSANAIYFANGLQPKKEFLDYAERIYFAKLGNINPQNPTSAVNEINNWVSKHTDGLIPTIVNEGLIKPQTKMVLINAMYFKGKWEHAFPQQATRAQKFYPRPSEPKCVTMMSLRANLKHNHEKDDLDADVLQIPFEGGKFTFAIIMPHDKNSKIQTLQHNLQYKSIPDILSDQDSLEVTLSLPRFKVEFETDLTEKLKQMRTTELFSDSAKLPNLIEGKKDLKVDAVIHKSFLEVNEDGALAASATGSSVVPLMSPSGSIQIEVDHPFLFFIYHRESKTILFEGRINQPQEVNIAECEKAKSLPPIDKFLDSIYNIDERQKVPGSDGIKDRFGSSSTNVPTNNINNQPQSPNNQLQPQPQIQPQTSPRPTPVINNEQPSKDTRNPEFTTNNPEISPISRRTPDFIISPDQSGLTPKHQQPGTGFSESSAAGSASFSNNQQHQNVELPNGGHFQSHKFQYANTASYSYHTQFHTSGPQNNNQNQQQFTQLPNAPKQGQIHYQYQKY